MRGLPKSNRVSWPSDVNLCQVRLFLSEESPSQVGLDTQDHLQAKSPWLLHSTGPGSDDNLPPGFEGSQSTNQLQVKLSQIPIHHWRCPSRLVLNFAWQVVAGEESQEVELQNKREMRVLEAVYPRPSSIPPNPSFPVDSEDSQRNDDRQTPLIPITPIEDEDSTSDPSFDSIKAPFNNVQISSNMIPVGPSNSSPSPSQRSVSTNSISSSEPDVVAAASAALGAIMKNNNTNNSQGNLIDHELLMNILSNPKMIEKLVADSGTVVANNPNIPKPISPPMGLPDPPPPLPIQMNRKENNVHSLAPHSNGTRPFYHPQPNGGVVPLPNPRGVPFSSLPPPSIGGPPPPLPPLAKDLNYYKSLIQQHGGERQESAPPPQFVNRHPNYPPGPNQEFVNNHKPKIMKPCIYFNSSRGCRHGANCSYQHDPTFQQGGNGVAEVQQNAKRMKFDREISSWSSEL